MPPIRILLTLILLAIFSEPCTTRGQNLPRRYEPARPTLSPYLNLFRANAGPIPNYYTFVRPQLEQNVVNQTQQAAIARQGASLQQLSQGVRQSTDAGLAPTGTGSRFMNLSHFYPVTSGARR